MHQSGNFENEGDRYITEKWYTVNDSGNVTGTYCRDKFCYAKCWNYLKCVQRQTHYNKTNTVKSKRNQTHEYEPANLHQLQYIQKTWLKDQRTTK